VRAGKSSVVLVDDSTDVRTLVRMRLESSGWFDVVGEAADGEEAVTLVHRHEPDLVLLDTSMPTMDGLEVLPAVKSLLPDTVVVMFSGFEGTGLAARARELGAADFVEKSIPLEELPQRLLRALDRPAPVLAVEPVVQAPGPRAAGEPGAARPQGLAPGDLDLPSLEQAIVDEHQEQFRALFDRAAIGMATLTINGTVVRANEALAALMSCEPYDLVGIDYGRLTVGRGEVLDRHLEVLRTTDRDLATFEHRLPAPEGEPASRLAQVTLAPIRDSAGQVLYVFAQVQDITAQRAAEDELRRTEENLRLLVGAVEEYAIYMLDTRGAVISWNSGARRIKGYTHGDILGQHFGVFYSADEQEAGHPDRNLEVALREGKFAEEGWRVRKDGSRFWASVVITPVHDDMGRHIGFAKITRDHTEQREHAEARRIAVEQQTHLLAVTAHELRNPTAVIDGSAGVLQESWDGLSDDEREQYLRGIRSSADRLRRLAADLATASRLQGEGLQFWVEDVALPDLLRSAASRRGVAGHGVCVEVDIDPAFADEQVVRADGQRLAQAVDNLLDNAVRHGAPPILLAGAVERGEVVIRVSDAGPGVPADVASRLFDRFATGGTAGGTGLGLYLVREIARGHGGEAAYLPPAPGRPATFEIRFPLVPQDR
jgi:PAS domain S-box-containing protein